MKILEVSEYRRKKGIAAGKKNRDREKETEMSVRYNVDGPKVLPNVCRIL